MSPFSSLAETFLRLRPSWKFFLSPSCGMGILVTTLVALDARFASTFRYRSFLSQNIQVIMKVLVRSLYYWFLIAAKSVSSSYLTLGCNTVVSSCNWGSLFLIDTLCFVCCKRDLSRQVIGSCGTKLWNFQNLFETEENCLLSVAGWSAGICFTVFEHYNSWIERTGLRGVGFRCFIFV